MRGGDFGAEPPAVELSCLLVCKYPKKVARMYPQAKVMPCLLSLRPSVPQDSGLKCKAGGSCLMSFPGLRMKVQSDFSTAGFIPDG